MKRNKLDIVTSHEFLDPLDMRGGHDKLLVDTAKVRSAIMQKFVYPFLVSDPAIIFKQ